MAQTYSLSLYSITIHKIGNKGNRMVLTDFHNGKSLYDIAYNMLCSIKYKKEIEKEKENLSQKNDTEEKRFFRIMKGTSGDVLNDRRPYLTGFIESGEYGTEENIVNVETGETKEKKLNDALLKPFYFMLYVPTGGKRAILLLERISNYGILTVFEKKIREALSDILGEEIRDYILSIEPLALDTVLEKHMTVLGGAKKVILNRVKFSDFSASKISDGELDNNEINNIQVVFNAPRRGSINILSWFHKMRNNNNNRQRAAIYSVDGVEYEDVKFEVEIGGSVRTISMQDVRKLGTYLDITDKIELDSNRYPTFASVDKEANSLISDIKRQIEENENS